VRTTASSVARGTCLRVAGAAAWLCITVASTPCHAAAPGLLAADFDALLAREHLTGVAWSTVDGELVTVGARGTADAARGTPLRADARLQVGSIAKTIVALAVLRRVSQGALAWRHRPGRHATPGTWLDLGAVALGFALVGLLLAFGLWPLMLWRL
jgi:CubicO group peptidase (beta-lactamase class C family)